MVNSPETKLQLLNEWQDLQAKLDATKETYSHTDEYAYMRSIRTLADYDISSSIHHSCAKLQDYLDGRTMYPSEHLKTISEYFAKLSEITARREAVEKNKKDWEYRIKEIKQELGVK